ncbi:MAG: amidohydrolase [Frankiales bacterium]|jgi:amidohydrolase|nr:amidohydrolase [Frankiales bacterium]
METEDLVRLRRALHADPEVGLDLPRTQDKVLAALDGLPLELVQGGTSTSVTAVLRGGGPGPVVLLRADMDALPVVERTGLPYASSGPAMHACGHDLHTTMLVGAAHALAAKREQLRGDVVLMFQPGEEGYDGAAHMLAEGVLQAAGRPIDAAYALHVASSTLPAGVFATRPGPMMAAAGVLHVTVRGAGGHGATPHRAKDPVPAACEMVGALQTWITRTFDVFDPVVLTVGQFHAGTAHNVIPDEAVFEATLRSFSVAAQERLLTESVRVVRGVAAAHGVQVEVTATELFPLTTNDAGRAAHVGDLVRERFGEQRFVELPHPLTGSEDFSRVLDAVPGAMVFLGATPAGLDPRSAPFNHSPLAAFDDSVLADGAALYAELACSHLG